MRSGRITVLDTLRGLTVASMVLFHACYDLAYLKGVPMPWFEGTALQTAWRCSISWTFLLLAGWMTGFSRSNLKRAGLYAAVAAAVYAVTALAAVDIPISFGIIFCMAASTALYAMASRGLLDRIPPLTGLVASLALFALLYQVPLHRYAVPGLAWLGLPSPSFASGDYYPIIPYTFMYLAGSFLGRAYTRAHGDRGADGYPAWTRRDVCPPLTFLGRHSLLVYILHQPLVLIALGLL